MKVQNITVLRPDITLCDSCKSPVFNYMPTCPSCYQVNRYFNAIGEKVYQSEVTETFQNIQDSNDANNLARHVSNGIMGNTYTFGQFVANYAVFIHNISLFLFDWKKSAYVNKRVSEANKMLFINEFMEYAYSDGTVFADIFDLYPHRIDSIVLNGNNNKDATMEKQQSHRYYFEQINIDDPSLVPFLGRMILFHKTFENIPQEWVESISYSQKTQSKAKFKWVNGRIEAFLLSFKNLKNE